MKKLLLPLLLLMFTNLSAQQASIKGLLLDNEKKPVGYANVLLLRSADSSLVKGMLSEESGAFLFEGLPAGKYKVAASMVGYAKAMSKEITLTESSGAVQLENLVLQQNSTNLKEVVVEGQRPLIEQHMDKTVMNVENSITAAGNTALEVLEKAPGVTVDQNDNISMRGRGNVIVMIDGKQVPMSGSELANVLRGMSASSVDKIELITNPSSKYDAAGNSGIIDIKLKRDKSLGTNGTLSSSFGYGEKFKTNQSLQLNHRSKKFNVFGNYNFVNRDDFTNLNINRTFYDEQKNFTGNYDQRNRFDFNFNTHNVRVGADYYVTPKTIVGVVASGYLTDIDRTNYNRAAGLNSQGEIDSTFITSAIAGHDRSNQGINFNFKHTIDSTGRELSGDLDYIAYQNSDEQDFTTKTYLPSGELKKAPELLYGTLDGKLTIQSAKLDYTQPLKSINGKLDAGFKSSLVSADNNLEFYDRSNGGNVFETDKSNHFLYDENINAAYLNTSKKWEKMSLQVGLRLENTISKGEQLADVVDEDEREFDRNYTQLFPSAFLGYTLSKKHDFGLSLSRRINRPSYNQLNPFKNYLDPSTYSSGNPYLKPETSYSFEFTHTFDQRIVTKLSYSHTSDVMVQVLQPEVPGSKIVEQTFENLAQNDYYAMSVTLPFSVGNWFNSVNNGTLYYSLYRGDLANTNLHNGQPSFNINSNNTINLSKGWSAELIGVFRGAEAYGFMDVDPIWFMSAGVQKQFWDKKASLKLNVSDIFFTNKTYGYTATSDYSENFYQKRDSRVATLSFNYRFGKSQAAPARRRTGGAEEEKNRAGS
ncbi:TonB-dependent receptor [Pontibacter sp. KCTC 32443]|uniref:TonB-dependent receptor domain-containing protein n=1 Tax=Pontibacter TaxID=323449 RepID=UPI00164DEF47|nr:MULTISPECIES: TonB-dependent receptor [Pontibacter]MBC5773024.1 TonB-dependent receptor [Pontibacter sp. KCTC 32443]